MTCRRLPLLLAAALAAVLGFCLTLCGLALAAPGSA